MPALDVFQQMVIVLAARVHNSGNEPGGSTPEQFAAKFQADIIHYAKVTREARLPLMD